MNHFPREDNLIGAEWRLVLEEHSSLALSPVKTSPERHALLEGMSPSSSGEDNAWGLSGLCKEEGVIPWAKKYFVYNPLF